MKKILITGSLGYIGSVLVPFLSEGGYECKEIDTGFYKDCTLWDPAPQQVVYKDARNITINDLSNVDVVIHLAAMSNDPFGGLDIATIYNPTREYALNIARLCKRKGIKFIFSSSCSVYGKGTTEILDESSPTAPQTPYSLNKLQIENDLRTISDKDFHPICFRFATVFGPSPRMRFDLVINMFVGMAMTSKKIILNSDGQAWRPNVYIMDVCKALKYGIEYESDLTNPLILNVGDTSQNFKIIDLAKVVQMQVAGSSIEFLQNVQQTPATDVELIKDRKIQDGIDTRTYRVSFERIKTVFKGFKCDWTITSGVKAMFNQFEKINLTEKQFKNINFYRLQKIESLYKTGLIDKNLHWVEDQSKHPKKK